MFTEPSNSAPAVHAFGLERVTQLTSQYTPKFHYNSQNALRDERTDVLPLLGRLGGGLPDSCPPPKQGFRPLPPAGGWGRELLLLLRFGMKEPRGDCWEGQPQTSKCSMAWWAQSGCGHSMFLAFWRGGERDEKRGMSPGPSSYQPFPLTWPGSPLVLSIFFFPEHFLCILPGFHLVEAWRFFLTPTPE